jgi:hypothetical protein
MRSVRSCFRPLLLSLTLAWAIPSAARADEPAFPATEPPVAETPAPEAPVAETPVAEAPAPQAPRAPAPVRSDLPPPRSRHIPGGASNGSIGGAPVYDVEARTAAAAAATGQRAASGTGIVSVTPREVVAAGGGGTEFKVRFRVAGDAGRSFYLNSVFLDPATGQAVKARRPGFADRTTGALYVLLTPVSHPGGTTEYQALIQLPSDTMDPVAAGTERRLDARVQLFRRSNQPGAVDESMDWSTVPFVVRGPGAQAAPARAAAPPPVSPSVATGFPEAAPATASATPAAPATEAPSATRIVNVIKHHNEPASDGRYHLRLETPYEVVGDQGRAFFLQALFFDRATGQPIASTRPEFADQTTGALYVVTQPGRNDSAGGRYNAGLRVPYDAFPKPAPGATLGVEVRITLFRRDLASGADAEMDTATTTFSVHGE